ncbi:hypothetical protein ACWCOP_14145 [Maricaulaceae bacterium MS644]
MRRRAGQGYAAGSAAGSAGDYAASLGLGYSAVIQPVQVWRAVPILSEAPGGAAARLTRTMLWRRQARRQARLDARNAPTPDRQAQSLDQLLARRDAGVGAVAINADAVYAAIKSYGASFRPDPIAVDARCADAAARAIRHLDLAAARLRDLKGRDASGRDGSRLDRARRDIVREAGASLAAQMESLLDAVARARRLHQFYREQMREAVAHCASAGDTARTIQKTLDHSARARLDAYHAAYRAERARRGGRDGEGVETGGEDGETLSAAVSFAPVKLVDRLPAPEPAARLVREALAQIERNLDALDGLQAWAQRRAEKLAGAPRKTVSALDADRIIAAWRIDFAAPPPRRATPLTALLRR